MKRFSKREISVRVCILAATVLGVPPAFSQIAGLCNTGVREGKSGCTDSLVTPNAEGGGPTRDNHWRLAYPYPSAVGAHGVCGLPSFVRAWVDTPYPGWMTNGPNSEWITPYDGENPLAQGWYVYRVAFPVPSVLPGGSVPTNVRINGQLASDDLVYGVFLESPAGSNSCSAVTGQTFPINLSQNEFDQWWPFSFNSSFEITAGTDAYIYFLVQNYPDGPSATGLRVEFFSTSGFN